MRIATGILALTLIADQASKYWVIDHMALDQRLYIPVFDPYLVFAMAWNRGVNFGLFGSDSDVLRCGLALGAPRRGHGLDADRHRIAGGGRIGQCD